MRERETPTAPREADPWAAIRAMSRDRRRLLVPLAVTLALALFAIGYDLVVGAFPRLVPWDTWGIDGNGNSGGTRHVMAWVLGLAGICWLDHARELRDERSLEAGRGLFSLCLGAQFCRVPALEWWLDFRMPVTGWHVDGPPLRYLLVTTGALWFAFAAINPGLRGATAFFFCFAACPVLLLLPSWTTFLVALLAIGVLVLGTGSVAAGGALLAAGGMFWVVVCVDRTDLNHALFNLLPIAIIAFSLAIKGVQQNANS